MAGFLFSNITLSVRFGTAAAAAAALLLMHRYCVLCKCASTRKNFHKNYTKSFVGHWNFYIYNFFLTAMVHFFFSLKFYYFSCWQFKFLLKRFLLDDGTDFFDICVSVCCVDGTQWPRMINEWTNTFDFAFLYHPNGGTLCEIAIFFFSCESTGNRFQWNIVANVV